MFRTSQVDGLRQNKLFLKAKQSTTFYVTAINSKQYIIKNERQCHIALEETVDNNSDFLGSPKLLSKEDDE